MGTGAPMRGDILFFTSASGAVHAGINLGDASLSTPAHPGAAWSSAVLPGGIKTASFTPAAFFEHSFRSFFNGLK
jgi:hypothetical protein